MDSFFEKIARITKNPVSNEVRKKLRGTVIEVVYACVQVVGVVITERINLVDRVPCFICLREAYTQVSRQYRNESGRHFRIYLENWTDLD